MKLNIYGNQPIITPRDPVLPMEAANKNYVDTGLALHASNLDLHLSAAQNIFLDGVTITSVEVDEENFAQKKADRKAHLSHSGVTFL